MAGVARGGASTPLLLESHPALRAASPLSDLDVDAIWAHMMLCETDADAAASVEKLVVHKLPRTPTLPEPLPQLRRAAPPPPPPPQVTTPAIKREQPPAPRAAPAPAQARAAVAAPAAAAGDGQPQPEPPKRRGRPPKEGGQYSPAYEAVRRYRARHADPKKAREEEVSRKLSELQLLSVQNDVLKVGEAVGSGARVVAGDPSHH